MRWTTPLAYLNIGEQQLSLNNTFALEPEQESARATQVDQCPLDKVDVCIELELFLSAPGCGISGPKAPDVSQRVTHHLPWIQARCRCT